MPLLSSIRSGTRPPLDQDRWSDASTPPPTGPAEADAPLPRHILVALAAIAADVTSLLQRSADEPQLHEPLDRILGRLDGLVDSIYDRAADTRAHPVDASSGPGPTNNTKKLQREGKRDERVGSLENKTADATDSVHNKVHEVIEKVPHQE